MPSKLIQGTEDVQTIDDGTIPAPSDWATALSRTVAEDLGAVLAPLGAPGRDMGWIAPAEAVQSVRPKPRRRSGWVSIAVGAALALAGIGGGLAGGYYLFAHAARRTPQTRYAFHVSIAPAPRAAPASPAPRPAPPTPQTMPPVAAPQPMVQPVYALEAKAVTADPAPDPAAERRAATDHEVKSLIAGCDRGAGCDRAAVARADRLVSDAYAAALRSGAPAANLADVQRRWNDLRRQSDQPPNILIGNYAVLATELSRMTPAAPRNRRPATGAAR